jgi:hypothetical protein
LGAPQPSAAVPGRLRAAGIDRGRQRRGEVSAQFSEKELAYLSSAIASINVWNRLGVAYRWTPPARQKAVDAAAS